MEWVRGNRIGHGSFGSVSLAIPRTQFSCSQLMAVKSCGVVHSASLMNEKLILDELQSCPQIISCYGDDFSFENGEKLYNVLLEYASGGSLADKLNNSGDHQLPEFEVRQYTKALLKGLQFIHKNGYAHCDIKLQNILLTQNGEVKIADFGLAKRVDELRNRELRGTPLYMSPEIVTGGDHGSPADIWALGCVVAEMLTGAPAWKCSDIAGLLMKIGVGDEVPEIPVNLSDEGKDFIRKCFIKDPRKRCTAEMLLDHPFVTDTVDEDTVALKNTSTSPRCPFDFPDWVSEHSSSASTSSLTCSITFLPSSSPDFDFDSNFCSGSWSSAPADRLKALVANQTRPDSFVTDDWITVR